MAGVAAIIIADLWRSGLSIGYPIISITYKPAHTAAGSRKSLPVTTTTTFLLTDVIEILAIVPPITNNETATLECDITFIPLFKNNGSYTLKIMTKIAITIDRIIGFVASLFKMSFESERAFKWGAVAFSAMIKISGIMIGFSTIIFNDNDVDATEGNIINNKG